MANQTKATKLAQLQALINGLQKQLPNGQFTLGNSAYTTATLVQTLQSLIGAITNVNAVQANAKVTVAAMNKVATQVDPVVLDLKNNLLSMYGSATDTLALFGLAPRKAPAPRTSGQKAASAAKAEATRKARGTTSKKQKLAVKGNVTGISITPITTPDAAAPSAQPVPATAAVTPQVTTAK
jgi:hypothetical protein